MRQLHVSRFVCPAAGNRDDVIQRCLFASHALTADPAATLSAAPHLVKVHGGYKLVKKARSAAVLYLSVLAGVALSIIGNGSGVGVSLALRVDAPSIGGHVVTVCVSPPARPCTRFLRVGLD